MPEIRQKATVHGANEEAVRVVEREVAPRAESAEIIDLERRVVSLQNEIAQLVQLAATARSQLDRPFGVAAPQYFAGLDRFGSVAPGQVPPPPRAHGGTPLFGFGAPAYPPEAVTMREFGATPPVTRPPGVNIVDAGDDYIVQVELPATQKKDLELLGSERSITVTAHVRPDGETEGTVLLGEVAPTTYRRTIHLPAACNTARSKATLKDGVLTLSVPKRDPSNGMRRIDVAYG